MSERIITLDVREELRQGREPFSIIMNAVQKLQSDERLRLIAPFEPVPLFSVLAKQGFAHESKRTDAGDWELVFTRQPGWTAAFVAPERPPCHAPQAKLADVIELDARGLEPPQPMIRILEALATLPEGAELSARTDRRPMHLYAQLDERGFVGETEEQENGSYLTRIRSR